MWREPERLCGKAFGVAVAGFFDLSVGASANLDTDQAAVWTHNKDEVADRNNLYYLKRRELCAYIGVRPGRALSGGASVIRT